VAANRVDYSWDWYHVNPSFIFYALHIIYLWYWEICNNGNW